VNPADAKIVAVVRAESSEGTTEMRFNLTGATDLSKLMNRWCGENGLAKEDASFLFGEILVLPGDTPCGIGHDATKGDMILTAVPSESINLEEKRNARISQVKAVQSLPQSPARRGGGRAGGSHQSRGRGRGNASGEGHSRSSTVPSAAAGKPAGSGRGGRRKPIATKADSDEEDGDLEDEDAATEATESQYTFRSARLRDKYESHVSSGVIVHYPPTSERKRKRDGGVPDAGEHMTYEEYLEYDRQLQREMTRAKNLRKVRRENNGTEGDGDEDYQLAVALSLSMEDGK